jgi:hypothetical protein
VKGDIHIQDRLFDEAHLDGDASHILLRREGEPGTVRAYLNEVRYLTDALCSVAAEIARRVVGDEE